MIYHRAIRPMTVAIIKNKKGEILVSPGYDKKRDHHFYRLLGGGIEFGELSEVALKREFKEELNVDLKNCQLLGIKENIFSFEEFDGHEICFIYSAEFSDDSFYDRQEFKILDSSDDGQAVWLNLQDRGDAPIYPSCLEWL